MTETGTIVSQGAEARVFLDTLYGRPCIIKHRFPKKYRHPTLDQKLRSSRTQQEARSLVRLREVGVPAPALLLVDMAQCKLYLEYIEPAVPLRVLVNDTDSFSEDFRSKSMQDAGRLIAMMHNNNIIHGDLTTSNMLFHQHTHVTYLIDLGLCSNSASAEDRAVDLYVLERAFLSSHPRRGDLFEILLDSYMKACHTKQATHARLEEVRMRGRKRTMLG